MLHQTCLKLSLKFQQLLLALEYNSSQQREENNRVTWLFRKKKIQLPPAKSFPSPVPSLHLNFNNAFLLDGLFPEKGKNA